MFKFLSTWFWLGMFLWLSGGLGLTTWMWMVFMPAFGYFIWGILRAVWWLLNPPTSHH